jgi:hypothetical protein
MQRRWRNVPMVWLATILAGCATMSAPAAWQPGNLQPHISGWQQYFAIQWTATPRGAGVLVDGNITNTWGFTAQKIQILVNGYDAAGKQVGQLIAWGPNEINPGSRAYFDVTVPPGANTYDVSIFSWNWVQVGFHLEQHP